jgi:histone deacetylase 6
MDRLRASLLTQGRRRDVHHGNGTQSAFYEDDAVLYISIHRHEGGKFFPGKPDGGHTFSGVGAGLGRNVNIPWPEGDMGDAEYLAAFQQIVMPIAFEYQPDLVIISAGFDAAEGDPLGGCHVSPQGYAQMTHMLSGLANGRVVAALEGGYNLESIASSALAVTETLLGDPVPAPQQSLRCKVLASQTIREVRREQARYWKALQHDKLDPIAHDDSALPDGTVHPLSTLLRRARSERAAQQYGLLELPTPSPSGKEEFEGMVLCTPDLFEPEKKVSERWRQRLAREARA